MKWSAQKTRDVFLTVIHFICNKCNFSVPLMREIQIVEVLKFHCPLRPYLNLTHNTDTQRFFPCALRICPLIHMFKKCHFRVWACVLTQVPFFTLGILFRDSSVTEMCVSVKMSVVRAEIFSLQLLALSLSPSIRQTNAKQQSLLSCQLLEMFRCLVYLILPSIRQCPPVGLRDRRWRGVTWCPSQLWWQSWQKQQTRRQR